jgi:hypothetical protein
MRLMVVLLVILGATASQPTWTLNNALAVEQGKWAALRNARVNDPLGEYKVSYPEVMAWQRVKAAWRQLEKQVDAEYRGEK